MSLIIVQLSKTLRLLLSELCERLIPKRTKTHPHEPFLISQFELKGTYKQLPDL